MKWIKYNRENYENWSGKMVLMKCFFCCVHITPIENGEGKFDCDWFDFILILLPGSQKSDFFKKE